MNRLPLPLLAVCLLTSLALPIRADEPDQTLPVWNGNPPGETTLSRGEALPTRPTEIPPATRITRITEPTLELFLPPADKATGTAVLIFPGGGYN